MAEVNEKPIFKQNAGDHLANERTYLAWIRTSIGIMGFGFVVVKFSLFVKQISVVLGTTQKIQQTGYSHVIGVSLVALGAFITIFSYIRYRNSKMHLEQGSFYQSTLLIKLLTVIIFVIGILLLFYLMKSTVTA